MKVKFVVLDDEGAQLRVFWSRAEAEAFLLPGYTIVRQLEPAKQSISELFDELGEGRF